MFKAYTHRYLFLLLILVSSNLFGQMYTSDGIKVGNEWIDFNSDYLKIEVSENAIYRIKGSTLSLNGLDISNIENLQMWHNGKEIPLYLSSAAQALGLDDYIEFVGFKNTIALDTFLYDEWKKDLLNPNYGLFTDVTAYFLTNAAPGIKTLRFDHITPDYSNSSIAILDYYRHNEIQNFTNSFYKPQVGDLKYSHFQPSEGYTSGLRDNFSVSVPVYNLIDMGQAPSVSLRMATNKNTPIAKAITWNNDLKAIDSTSLGQTANVTFDLASGDLKSSNNLEIKITNKVGSFGLATVETSYNRAFDFSKIPFEIVNTDNQIRKINLSGYSSTSPYILDIKNLKAISLNENALISDPNAVLVFANSYKEITNVQKKKFRNLATESATDYLFLTSSRLYNGSQGNPIDDYVAYRESPQGGGFKTSVLTVQEVYDQFGYGIPNHNWAFKNMSHYLKDAWPKLHYVLIIGKAREYENVRTTAQLANSLNESFFVPTFGTSPSDVLLFSPGKYVNSYFAIGRLAVSTINDVSIYLSKVKQHDLSIDAPQDKDKLWLKNIVHLGGGGEGGERSSIQFFLKQMEDTISRGSFGANVNSYFKTSATNVQVANLEGINKNISSGAAIVTFFGHASIGTFEFSLENPQNYANEGKYPFIFSLGCYSGNIHSPSRGISEDFLFAPERGAIAFIASAGTAYLFTQGIYGTKFYSQLTNAYYNERLGDMFKQFGDEEKDVFTTGEYTLYQQLTYHGDPAVKLFGFAKPDYAIDYETAKLNPEDIFIDRDSFQLAFNILNIGKAESENLELNIIQIGPKNDTVFNKNYFVEAPNNSKEYKFSIPLEGEIIGQNKLYVSLDPNNSLPELSESNNTLKDANGTLGLEFAVLTNEIFPTSPQEFSIYTGETPLQLITSSVNSFAKSAKYKIQLDTTELFNSGYLKEKVFETSPPFINWQPEFELIPGKVHYWRVCKVEEENQRSPWSVSSFIYQPGSVLDGWNQSHYYQWLKNENNIKVNENGTFEFNDALRNISISNGLSIYGLGELIGYSVDLSIYSLSVKPWSYINEGVAFAILDSTMGTHVINNGGQYGSIASTAEGTPRSFAFKTNTPEERQKVVNFIENAIPKGYYVSFMTILNNADSKIHVSEWESDTLIYGNSIVNALKNQGASLIDQLVQTGDVPYIFMFKKDVQVFDEKVASNKIDIIKTNMEFPYRSISGSFQTQEIGPAKSWSHFVPVINYQPENDLTLYVLSKSTEGIVDTLLRTKEVKEHDLSFIDADKYPFLYIMYTDNNSNTRKAAQVQSLKVYYENFPDLISEGIKLDSYTDTLDQGKILNIEVPVYLVAKNKLDSVELKIELLNSKNNKVTIINKIIPEVNIGKNEPQKFSIKTNEISGLGRLNFTINEKGLIKENNYSNNYGTYKIFVKPDAINPRLNVLQNNSELINNDVLPRENKFKILLTDENKYQKIEDPKSILATIKNDKGSIVYSTETDAQVLFKASTDAENNAYLEFNKELEDGKYTMEVQGRDASGNLSGENNLLIDFEVISKLSLTNLYNYPNPFSNRTQFVYTLTGEIPQKTILQIFTIQGKVVKEVVLSDLETPRLGNNLTNYVWDGTDDYGTKLATGTYLFRIKAYDSSNKPFVQKVTKNDFGKLVIIR